MATTTPKPKAKNISKKTVASKNSSKKPTNTTKKSASNKVAKPAEVLKTSRLSRFMPRRNRVNTKPTITMNGLFKWNKWLALAHAVQGGLILLLSTTQTLPVTTNFLSIDPLKSAGGEPVLVAATQEIGSLNLAYLVAAFFFISALAHALIATVYRNRYEQNLERGINKARWIEYSISASIMIVAVGMLVGIYDLSSLIMLFALTTVMNLLGLAMEVYNQKAARPNWLAYNIGCLAGIVPWIVVAIYLIGGALSGSTAPAFVYAIFVSIFLFFMSFAVNMYLQYRGQGKFSDYLYGERNYMVLSLVAKSALAWQIFGGTLRP